MIVARKVSGLLPGRRPAKAHGIIAVDGAAEEIVIRRDQWGVPHIDACSESGLGTCSAAGMPGRTGSSQPLGWPRARRKALRRRPATCGT